MALDYSKLSDEELEAIANNDYTKLSDATLNQLVNEAPASNIPVKENVSPMAAVAGPIAPAVTAAAYAQPTGLAQLGRDVAQASAPLVEAGQRVVQNYARSPGKAIVDVGAVHLGVPPPYATYETVKGGINTVKGAVESAKSFSDVLAKLPAGTDKLAEPFAKALRPADFDNFMELVKSQGLEKAFKTYQPPAYLGEDAVKSLNAVKGAFPSTAAKVGSVAGPLLRGAARVAGPVGLAYDIYEAAPYIAAGGQELASGRAQDRIRQAQMAVLNAPTPAPLTAQEAMNLLASGDTRTIDIYGGRRRLEEIVQSAVRQKAASRVLGPIAPGQ